MSYFPDFRLKLSRTGPEVRTGEPEGSLETDLEQREQEKSLE